MNNYKVLIASPIRQDNTTLSYFLSYLSNIKTEHYLEFYFIDNNDDDESSKLLQDFSKTHKTILERIPPTESYEKEISHIWKNELINNVANFKNKIISYAKLKKFDYLFFIDSDILISPKLLDHLINLKKDIVSEIFWSCWNDTSSPLPQVWISDSYNLSNNFIETLKTKDVFKVGGLGALTLISKYAINKNISFTPLYNLSYVGEDRHFCIRAVALGLDLFVDTNYPALHLYKKNFIDYIDTFEKNDYCFSFNDVFIMNTFEKCKTIFIKFINNFLSIDYRTFTGFEGMEFVTSGIFEILQNSFSECFKILREKKIITNPYNIEFLSLKFENNHYIISGKFNLNGFKETYEATCNFTIVQNTPIIDKLFFKKDENFLWGFDQSVFFNDKYRRVNCNGKILLSMIVKNEENKFLEKMLRNTIPLIDEAIIIDDGSTDNTFNICQNVFKECNVPLTLIKNSESEFKNEFKLRQKLWNLAIKTGCEWILCLDADEIICNISKDYLKTLTSNPYIDNYAFLLFDMWNETQYREDLYWQAHKYPRVFLTRYQPNFTYKWLETPIHCGRFPVNISNLETMVCNIKIKHLGWSTFNIRQEKFLRYNKLDPDAKYGIKEQYDSILDSNPILIDFPK